MGDVHERALTYMRNNPGTTYDAALRRCGGKVTPQTPDPVAAEFLLANPNASGEEALAYSRLVASGGAVETLPYSADHRPSSLHERAMRIMRETPGMTYEAAEAKARGR